MELLNSEYYLTVDDVINNSEFNEEDLKEVFGEKLEYYLKNISKKTYRIMYSAYCGWEIEQQIRELQYIINNDTTKQSIMLEAMIEYVRGAIYSGMDMNLYVAKSDHYSSEVQSILHSGGLWIKATIEASEADEA